MNSQKEHNTSHSKDISPVHARKDESHLLRPASGQSKHIESSKRSHPQRDFGPNGVQGPRKKSNFFTRIMCCGAPKKKRPPPRHKKQAIFINRTESVNTSQPAPVLELVSGLTLQSHNSEILSHSPFSSEKKHDDLREEIIRSPEPKYHKEKESDSVVGTPLNLESTKVKSFQSPLEIEDDKPPHMSSSALQKKAKMKPNRRIFDETGSPSMLVRSEILASQPGIDNSSRKKMYMKSEKKKPLSSIDIIDGKEKSEKSATSSKRESKKFYKDELYNPSLGSSLIPKRFTQTYEASIISFKSLGSKGTSFKVEDEKQQLAPSPQHSLGSREAGFRMSGSRASNFNGTPSFNNKNDRPPSAQQNANNNSLSRFHTLTAPAYSCVTSPVKNTSSSFLPIRSAKSSSTALHQFDPHDSSSKKKLKTALQKKGTKMESQLSEALQSPNTDRVPQENATQDPAVSCGELKRELQTPNFNKPISNQLGRIISGDRGSASLSAHNFDTSVSSFPIEKPSSRKSEVASPKERHQPHSSLTNIPQVKGLQKGGVLHQEAEEDESDEEFKVKESSRDSEIVRDSPRDLNSRPLALASTGRVPSLKEITMTVPQNRDVFSGRFTESPFEQKSPTPPPPELPSYPASSSQLDMIMRENMDDGETYSEQRDSMADDVAFYSRNSFKWNPELLESKNSFGPIMSRFGIGTSNSKASPLLGASFVSEKEEFSPLPQTFSLGEFGAPNGPQVTPENLRAYSFKSGSNLKLYQANSSHPRDFPPELYKSTESMQFPSNPDFMQALNSPSLKQASSASGMASDVSPTDLVFFLANIDSQRSLESMNRRTSNTNSDSGRQVGFFKNAGTHFSVRSFDNRATLMQLLRINLLQASRQASSRILFLIEQDSSYPQLMQPGEVEAVNLEDPQIQAYWVKCQLFLEQQNIRAQKAAKQMEELKKMLQKENTRVLKLEKQYKDICGANYKAQHMLTEVCALKMIQGPST